MYQTMSEGEAGGKGQAEGGRHRGTDGRAVVLQSPKLAAIGVPHGFSTRHGGVSGGMFASLNFGNPGDLSVAERDPATNIAANFGRLVRAIGVGGVGDTGVEEASREIVEVHQVHGAEVSVVMRGSPSPRAVDGQDCKADALVTNDPGRLVAVRVADCTPVLLASRDGRIVAAVHAGWRGVVGGVAVTAVDAMGHLGTGPGELVAAIGPCIGGEAFEVGPEVAAEFRRVFGEGTPHIRPGNAGKSWVDLQGALREQLVRRGVPEGAIDVLLQCTVRDAADFFSHRRERGRTGRMVGIIGPRAGGHDLHG